MANIMASSWSVAMRDGDRTRRLDVREERLRTAANLRGAPGLRLSSWRGRSGRRYVVGIHALTQPDLAEMTEAVVLAVRRDAAGTAQVIGAATAGEAPREALARAWMRRAEVRGATEIHVHRLAETRAERRAIVADLVCAGTA